MAEKNEQSKIILLVIGIVLFITLIFLFVIFLEKNYLWILPAFFYFIFFVFREGDLRFKDINDRLKVKDRREIRIDFWG